MADTSAFEGFSNAPKGVDFRDVPSYEDESEAGQVAEASRRTPSSITEFKTEGKGTNGAPAAVVVPKTDEPPADEDELGVDADGVDDTDSETADAAEGEEASQS